MAFCTNCGQQMADGAKFCANCGTASVQTTSESDNARKNVYEGEIHKCPNCGEILKSFETVCPTCNFELRGAPASSAVKDLAKKLENATSEKEKIFIIKNFPIPNTREDILEFMFWASSNFDVEYYASHLNEDDITDAWLAKIELCYNKARLVLSENDVNRIEKIYLEIKSKISKASFSKKYRNVISIACITIGLLLIMTQNTIVGTIGLVLLAVGIARIVTEKRKTTDQQANYYTVKKGFSSWSTQGKVWWIILNVFTLGIPAIIYIYYKNN